MTFEWIVILSMLILSGFFAGLEIASLTANKLRIELMSKRNIFPYQILSFFSRNTSSFISTMLVGNCIAMVVFSIFMAQIIEPFVLKYTQSDIAALLIESFISTVVILIGAEFLPKNLFRINPDRVMVLFAIPLFIVYWALSPIVFLTNGLARILLKVGFGTKFPDKQIAFGRIDLDHFIRESTSPATQKNEIENEVKIFKRALGFSKVKARDCMIPRTEIVAINVDDSVENLKKLFIETRLSKILIYRDSVDNIIGYTHSYELFKNPENILSILLPVIIVPESKPANEVLTMFIQQHKSVALVVDEFGGTSGMLTTEDIIEEIFGEIEDEHDKEEMIEKKISNNEFIFSGRLEIDYLNERYKLSLPQSDEYTTLAGLLLHLHQKIPAQNEIVIMNPYVFKILNASGSVIDQVEVKIV
ncbi:MAG TPA: hemolysin family protein [Bacteroidia bacterium]|jgi:CBS domain containing-hemolysin-like protein|nr:hemolysin family protein [Bacteroidia bacterium]